MNKRLLLPLVGLLILLGIVSIPFWKRGAPEAPGQAAAQVTMGIQTSPAMALVMVAKDEGLFQREGVDVQLKQFSAGKFALQAMLGRSIDFAIAGEVPVGLAVMQGNPVRVYSQVVRKTTNEVRMVARAPAGQTPEAFFAGGKRRVATSLGGGPEFFTWSYLNDVGVPKSAVEIVGQKPEDMPASLASGSVDAIAVFDPFAYIAERQQGRAAHTFPDRGVYSELYVLAARPETGAAKQREIGAILRALRSAERLIAQDPPRAKRIVQRYTGLDPAVLDGIWGNFDFAPALTPMLLDYWNRQFEWARQTGKIKKDASRPDFAATIDSRLLDGLRGEAQAR
jgi:NitT/TauT family transport system substrate-binding protein